MQYFTISELIKSEMAIKKKIWNGASREVEDNLIALVENVLDPLRRQFGSPVKVTSGYRCKDVNKDVGGTTGSQHLVGEAADIVAMSGKKSDNYVLGRLAVIRGNFDQIIFENVGRSDLLPEWIHISYRRVKSQNRGKILKKIKGTSGYLTVSRKELNI